MPVYRRDLLRAGLVLPGLVGFRADAAPPDMLLAYLSARLNALAAKWDAERARIRTGRRRGGAQPFRA